MMVGTSTSSLEIPVMLQRSGRESVMGIISEISAGQCRLRALIALESGERIEFVLHSVDHKELKLRGIVVGITSKPPRVVHDVALDEMPVEDRYALSGVVEHVAKQKPPAEFAKSALMRSSVRAPADFAVRFAGDSGEFHHGRAANISIGGLMMLSDREVAVGTTLGLRFSLAPGATEVTVKARVVARHPADRGKTAHNLAFFNLDPKVRSEIAAFVERAAPA
jgi:hypothetical protein